MSRHPSVAFLLVYETKWTYLLTTSKRFFPFESFDINVQHHPGDSAQNNFFLPTAVHNGNFKNICFFILKPAGANMIENLKVFLNDLPTDPSTAPGPLRPNTE